MNTSSPVISVLVPLYNHIDQLPFLLKSILNQTFTDLEVVIVDDGSDLLCDNVVEEGIREGLAIRLIRHTERMYTMKARLRCIAEARGQLLLFADADDILWGRDALGVHIAEFLKHDADILHFRAVFTDVRGEFSSYAPLMDPFSPYLQGNSIFDAFSRSNIWGSSTLWNKIFTKKIGMQILETASRSRLTGKGQDMYLVALLLLYARKYVGSDLVGYGYRHVKDKVKKEHLERAVSAYITLEELIPHFETYPASCESVKRFSNELQKYLCTVTGWMCMGVKEKNGIISEEFFQALMGMIDQEMLIKVLLLGNKLNAQKIVRTYKATL